MCYNPLQHIHSSLIINAGLIFIPYRPIHHNKGNSTVHALGAFFDNHQMISLQ